MEAPPTSFLPSVGHLPAQGLSYHQSTAAREIEDALAALLPYSIIPDTTILPHQESLPGCKALQLSLSHLV